MREPKIMKQTTLFPSKDKMKKKEKPKIEKPQVKVTELEREKVRWYLDAKPTVSITTRNKRILSLLDHYGASTIKELSRLTDDPERTIQIELKYMEKLGFVRKV